MAGSHRRNFVYGVVMAATALGGAGCSNVGQPAPPAPAVEPGPLAETQSKNEICAPLDPSELVTANAATWRYTTGDSLTIDAVSLNDPDARAELVTSVLVPSPVTPNGESGGILAAPGYPPAIPEGATQRWDLRREAPGAVYEADSVPLQLFVVLRRIEGTARTESLTVSYHRGEERFIMTIPVSYRLIPPDGSC